MLSKSITTTLAAAAVVAVAVGGWWVLGSFGIARVKIAEGAEVQEAPNPTGRNAVVSAAKDTEAPAAMADLSTYAAVRLKEIKSNPDLLGDVWAWRREWTVARSIEMKRQVLGLAIQVGPDAYLAIMADAINAPDEELQLEAVRSLALLPEDRLREGVAVAVNAAQESIRAEAMEVVSQLNPRLQPALILAAVQVGPPDVQKIAISMAQDRPSPEMFEVLLQGLRSDSPETRPLFDQAIAGMVQQQFRSYEEATNWWSANRERFDGMMLRSE